MRQDWPDRCDIAQRSYQDTLWACDGRADLVLTSPPYCDARTYGADVNWTLNDYLELGEHVLRALRPGGHALINVDAPVREWREGMGTERGLHPWRMLLGWADMGFRVPDRLAFGRLGIPGAYVGRFRNDWEPLLWFQKPGGDSFFDRSPLRTKARWKMRGSTSGRLADGGQYRRNQSGRAAREGTRERGTLWSYGHVGKNNTGANDIEAEGHPARWPYKLAADLVACFCPADGLACDPFLGAGTSAVAALDLDRRFVGGDLFSRVRDGKPWADGALDVIQRRGVQFDLFDSLGPRGLTPEVSGE